MVEKGVLLGYGNPLLDISVQATKDFLNKYAEMSEQFKDVDYVPGGAALNATRVAQWLLQSPEATSFFGCIGHDKFGEILTKAAHTAGVDVKFQYTSKEPTGTCAVVCTDKNRSLVANLAAANCFSEDHLDVPENWKQVEKAKFYYFAGYPLTVCPSAMLRIAKHAAESNKVVCMNMSAPFLCTFFKEPMLKMLPYADYWFGNESEADEFAKANELGTTDRKEIAKKLGNWEKVNKARSRVVVITQGSDPVIVFADGQLREYPVIPIKSEDIVDSNGAGDSFVGGFLSQLVKGKSLDECIRCGHYTANVVLQRTGCTLPDKPDFV
ncbi:adenosine kinase [Plakobranchus ocellatus]|uniref:Adenosine kinase n=1 Tax=Plakobranchus ocellatus TaxID=259542 RepID=A0AAV3YHX0_9GAST|nr:adenosine kinase [Plakobranchus ocellatus]